jgi:parallel beta-helix repeat protein
VVRGCTSKQNAVGIETGSSSLVSGNNVSSNNTCGIYVEDGCTVVGNNVNSNSIGVRGSTGVTLLDNTVRSSSDFGFRFDGANNGYARNVLTNNNGGDANAQVGGAGTGIQIGTNICGNDTVCP